MKVLPFTIPALHDKTILIQEDVGPHFYPHLRRHEEIQLTMIMKGEGTLLAGTNLYPFRPNEIYLVGANIPHVFNSDVSYFAASGEKEIHALSVFFNTRGKLKSLFELPELKKVSSFLSTHYSGFKIPVKSFSDIADRIRRIKFTNGMDQLMEFFGLLESISSLNHIAPLAPEPAVQSFTDNDALRFGNVYQFIMQHYAQDITLEDAAAAANMTTQAFCRYFKKHTRFTFVTFLNTVRINMVRKKLVSGSYESISAVAYDCGFNSITNFNRMFKSITGFSPREYTTSYLRNTG